MLKIEIPDPFDFYDFKKSRLKKHWGEIGRVIRRDAKAMVKKSRYTSNPQAIPLGKSGLFKKSIYAKARKDGGGVVIYPKMQGEDRYGFPLIIGHSNKKGGVRQTPGRASPIFLAGKRYANNGMREKLAVMFGDAFQPTKLRTKWL